ncbi:MAG: VWA domain-containing protein [Bryobacteraceae bacterium]
MRASPAELWGRLITCGPIDNRPSRAPARPSRFAQRPKLPRCAVLLLLLCAPLLAQTSQPAPTTASLKLKSESRLVLVDAIVTGKKGAAIPGLTASDFHVFEDGKEQPITAFQSHAGPAAPGMPQQHFLLLFDGKSNDDLRSIQEPAARFIADNAGPDRLMSIAYYSSGCMTITTQFTADVGELQHALGALPGLLRCGFVPDPDGDLQALYYAQLARDLAHVPGHKVVALFVPGAPPRPSDAERWVNSGNEGIGRSVDPVMGSADPGARASELSGLTPGIASPPRNAGRDPFGMEAEFRKADVSVYPVEAQSGARTSGWALHLADATGGRELNRGNDVLAAFELLAREQDEAYTLGYVPQESPEGSCHALKVTVDRRDAKVRGRTLYCNVREVSLAAANPLEQELETLAASPHAGNAAALVSVPFFYEPNGVARVNLAIEIPAPVLHPTEMNGKLHAEMDVLGLAYNLGDEVAARFSDTVRFDFGSRRQFDDFLRQPLHYERQFKIAPGNYRFKLIFRPAKDSFGVVETPLAIGPFDARKLSLSAIALARNVQPMSPEDAQEAVQEGKRPLTFRGNRIVVSGSDILPKAGLAEAYFEIYEPLASPAQPVHLSMRLRVLDAQNAEQKWASGDVDLSALAKSGDRIIPVALKLPVATLPPGTYHAELTVKDSAGAQATRSIQFHIE